MKDYKLNSSNSKLNFIKQDHNFDSSKVYKLKKNHNFYSFTSSAIDSRSNFNKFKVIMIGFLNFIIKMEFIMELGFINYYLYQFFDKKFNSIILNYQFIAFQYFDIMLFQSKQQKMPFDLKIKINVLIIYYYNEN